MSAKPIVRSGSLVIAIVLGGCGYYPNPWLLDDTSSDEGSGDASESDSDDSSSATSLDEIGSLDDATTSSEEGDSEGPSAWETFAEIEEWLDDLAAQIKLAHAEDGHVPKRCPHPTSVPAGGDAGITPPLAVNCHAGADFKCHADPEFDPENPAPGGYDALLWKAGMWGQIDFLRESHYAHYDFVTINQSSGGEDECTFTVFGYVDRDNDGMFTVYSRDYGYDGIEWHSGDLIKYTYP